MIIVKMTDIEALARTIKENPAVMNAWINIGDDGELSARWYYGRSDFVLSPRLIILPGVGNQSKEAIIYAIRIFLRNHDGYTMEHP